MENIIITKTDKGFIIKFPYIGLQFFKPVFKSARWNAENKYWEVGPRAGKKLEAWAENVDPKITELLRAEDVRKNLEEEKEISEKELERIEYSYKNLLNELKNNNQLIEQLKIIQADTEKLKIKIELLKKEKEISQHQADDALKVAKELVNSVCDVEMIQSAYLSMLRCYSSIYAADKNKYREAQAVLREENSKLKEVGYFSGFLANLADLNWNRKDRDNPHNYNLDDLYNIEKI